MGKKLQGGFALLICGATLFACTYDAISNAYTAIKNRPQQPPLTWHYIGPDNQSDLVKEAIDVLAEACPGIMVYNEYFDKPTVAWRVIDRSDPLRSYGVTAGINFSTTFKDAPVIPEPIMPMFSGQMLNSHDKAILILLGPPANGIVVGGKGGYFLCNIDKPPIGGAPIFKPEPRLSGLIR